MASRRSSRRNFNPMSLAFIDVMACGFGAVVLIFLILDHSSQDSINFTNSSLAAEINLLQEEILTGEDNLVQIRNTISNVDLQIVEAQGRARSIQEEINTFMEMLARLEDNSSADENILRLQNEIAALEAEIQRLRAAEDELVGTSARRFVGDGNRQYLTGLILGGNRILILIDTSSSMLDDTIVNIIRRRNMPDEAKLNSPKWQGILQTMDWLSSQLPIPSQYQIYTFSNEVSPALPNTLGQWLEVADNEQLNEAVANLNTVIPEHGTNLEQVFQAISGLNPLPDNIFLITDGLPTLSSRSSNSGTISGRDRERLFQQAMDSLPRGIPVNVILAPLEGDPMAASLYWRLALATGGSFINPSEDWP